MIKVISFVVILTFVISIYLMFDQSPIVSYEQDEKNPDSSKNIGIQTKNRTSPNTKTNAIIIGSYRIREVFEIHPPF